MKTEIVFILSCFNAFMDMKLSWSHKLFLRINEQIGQHPRFDAVMKFCGESIIYILFFCFTVLFFVGMIENRIGWNHVEIFFVAFFFAFLLSYSIAWLFPHARPVKELPQVKNLFKTLGTWKSFPSDHTIAVSLLALLSFGFFGQAWGYGFLVGALLVATGRVYGGVHYPRDIVGGVLVATTAFLFSLAIYPHLF